MSNLAPFRSGTRQRRAKVGVVAYATASTATPLEMPRVGYLSRIFVQFRGTVTLSGAGALADKGPWNLISRLKVNTNIGSAALVDVSGYGLYAAQKWLDDSYLPDQAGSGTTTPSADIHAAPVAMGANTWVLSYDIPIGANSGPNFETGLINLQAPETRVTCELTFGQLTDPATLVTATTGNAHVYYEYYELPDPTKFAMPPLSLFRTLEETMPIGATGDVVYTVPRMGILLQVAHVITCNATRSDGIDECSVRYNKTDTVYRMERQWMKQLDRKWYGTNPVVGVYFHDWWNAFVQISSGDTRDAIDTEELSTLELVVTVSSGTTLGANNNTLQTVRRIAQTLEAA